MKRMGMALSLVCVVLGVSQATGLVWAADGESFDFQEQVKKGEQRAGFTLQQMVKTPDYTVGAVAVKDEIKMHIHRDGDHNLYIVSGQGSATVGDKQIPLKAGMLLHIPKGIPHGIKAAGGDLTLVDFAQPPFDPNKMEWVK